MKILLTSAMALSMIVMFGANQPVQAAADSQQGQLTLIKHGHHGGGGHHGGHHGRHHGNWGGDGYWGGGGYYYGGPNYYYGPGYYSDPYYYYDAPGLCVGPLCIF